MQEISVSSRQLSYKINQNLTHFTTYNIELYACRESLKDEDAISLLTSCSVQKAMTSAKTSRKGKTIIFIIY